MKVFDLTLRLAGATLVLLVLQTSWDRLWIAAPFTREVGPPALSGLMVVLALSLVAASSSQRGWRLAGTFFILYFGINRLSSLDEAFLYKAGIKSHGVFRLIGSGSCTALIFTPLLVLILGCWKSDGQEESKNVVSRSAINWVGRIVLGDFLYILCYFIAGAALFHFVKDFSARFEIPHTSGLIAMELLRGLVYVAAGLAVTSGMKGKRSRAAATLGLAFPILAGVAPLLVHNPYVPDYVRLAHGFETGTSNLAFGALLGHILTVRAAPAVDGPQAQNAEFLP